MTQASHNHPARSSTPAMLRGTSRISGESPDRAAVSDGSEALTWF